MVNISRRVHISHSRSLTPNTLKSFKSLSSKLEIFTGSKNLTSKYLNHCKAQIDTKNKKNCQKYIAVYQAQKFNTASKKQERTGSEIRRFVLDPSIQKKINNNNINITVKRDDKINEQYGIQDGIDFSKDLHPIEKHLFKSAIKHLNGNDQTINTDTGYKQNIVLVDFLVRNTNKQGKILNEIKIDENTKSPETHTIVLWKQRKGDIQIIDPSRTSFSAFLGGNDGLLNQLYPNSEQKFNTLNKKKYPVIYGSNGQQTGYSFYTDENPKPRDCIDIAVKIAFELSELIKQNLEVEGDDLALLESTILKTALSKISNQFYVNSKKIFNGAFYRKQQSSLTALRNTANESTKKFSTDFDKSITTFTNDIKKYETQIIKNNLYYLSKKDNLIEVPKPPTMSIPDSNEEQFGITYEGLKNQKQFKKILK